MIIKFRALLDTDEDVFRDIEIRDSSSFEEFHYAILDSFGWEADQMASFYESNEDWDKGDEIPLMDIAEDFGPAKRKVMSDVTLSETIQGPGQKMLYVFDFMLMWCFYLDVISIEEEKANSQYPQLLVSVGDTPNQNEKETLDFSKKKGEDDDDDDDGEFEYNVDDLINY